MKPTQVNMGQKFGDWEVISTERKNNKVLCKCTFQNCGCVRWLSYSCLKSGGSRSCRKCCGKKIRTHFETKTRLYRIWQGMKDRCNNENSDNYDNYGKRGIIVCKEWIDKFENFRDWSLLNGYNDTLELDRIDVNGNYDSVNCRWITKHQNSFNKRPKKGTSKYKGVSLVTSSKRTKKWISVLTYNKKSIYIGHFYTEEEAALAYNKKAKEIFGEYAYLNRIEI